VDARAGYVPASPERWRYALSLGRMRNSPVCGIPCGVSRSQVGNAGATLVAFSSRSIAQLTHAWSNPGALGLACEEHRMG
jgi:hypothetical protein